MIAFIVTKRQPKQEKEEAACLPVNLVLIRRALANNITHLFPSSIDCCSKDYFVFTYAA
jgi:hypothetical protein